MEECLKKGMPEEKIFNFNDFFGKTGDVPNPLPDDEDEFAQKRYRDCLQYLRNMIERRFDKILDYL